MPSRSPFPDVDLSADDLWDFMFRRPRDFADSQVIYRCAVTSRKHTFQDVRNLSLTFGQGLATQWQWAKGDVLALYAPNDIDVPPVVYGVLYAGGIVSPANPTYSAGELAFQLTNSGSKALVTTAHFLPTALKAATKSGIPAHRILVLGQQRDGHVRHWTELVGTQADSSSYRRPRIDPDADLAFLVYSSGTTGLPKGVMLSHRNLTSNLLQLQNSIGQSYASRTDKLLALLPFFHIYGLTILVHQPLHRGIDTVVMPAFEIRLFCESIQRHRITFIFVAPPVLVRLAHDKLVEGYDLSSVKMITSGAAPLTRELVEAVHKRLRIKVNQAYGLSETSPVTHMQPWADWYSAVGSVGKLMPNMTIKYMSALDPPTEVAAGTPGEIWVRGPNIFKGYWRNPKATASCLTPDGYFQTGDIGLVSTASDLYIVDRVKELIKYKGFQVAPAELEGKLLDHPNIVDVAVIGVEDRAQHTEVPRAYVVAKDPQKQGKQDEKEIGEWLASKVARHKKLRGGVRFIQEIPKSASGKILRRVLKDQAKSDDQHGRPRL